MHVESRITILICPECMNFLEYILLLHFKKETIQQNICQPANIYSMQSFLFNLSGNYKIDKIKLVDFLPSRTRQQQNIYIYKNSFLCSDCKNFT